MLLAPVEKNLSKCHLAHLQNSETWHSFPWRGKPSSIKKKGGGIKHKQYCEKYPLLPAGFFVVTDVRKTSVFFPATVFRVHNLPSLFIFVSAVGPGTMQGLGVPKNLHVNLVSPKLNY